MPDLIGVESGDAQAELGVLGVRVVIIELPTTMVPKGHVFSHAPGPGSPIVAGDEVTLNVSSGPPDTASARINTVTISGSSYAASFETFAFEPAVGSQHVRFFFDTVPPTQAGVPGSGPWVVHGGPSPFTGYATSQRPPEATRMCIIVASADHTVQSGSGNCVALPAATP